MWVCSMGLHMVVQTRRNAVVVYARADGCWSANTCGMHF